MAESNYAGEITVKDAALAASMDELNATVLRIILPLKPVIDRDPVLPARFKQDLFHRPIDAMVGLLAPVDDFIIDIVAFANEFSGKYERVVGPPGEAAGPRVTVSMRLNWPTDAQWTSLPAKDFIKRLKLVLQLLILGYYDKVALTVGIGKTLVKRGKWGLAQLANLMAELGLSNAPPAPTEVVNDVSVTKPAVDAYVAFAASMGLNYVGMVEKTWASGGAYNNIWMPSGGVYDRISAAKNACRTDAGRALCDRLKSAMDKIIASSHRIDDIRKQNNPDVANKTQAFTEAALRYVSDGIKNVALQGLGRHTAMHRADLAYRSGMGGLGALPAAAAVAIAALGFAGTCVTAIGGIICALTPYIGPIIYEKILGRPMDPNLVKYPDQGNRQPQPGEPGYRDPNQPYPPQQPQQPAAGLPMPLILGGVLLLAVVLTDRK